MTPRERVRATLSHREPDRPPIDFGGHRSSGIAAIAYVKVGYWDGLAAAVEPVKLTMFRSLDAPPDKPWHWLLVVVCAGNKTSDNPSTPGRYDECLSVGATDRFDGRAPGLPAIPGAGVHGAPGGHRRRQPGLRRPPGRWPPPAAARCGTSRPESKSSRLTDTGIRSTPLAIARMGNRLFPVRRIKPYDCGT